jgi:poly(A) RNA polymerase, mitochondrial
MSEMLYMMGQLDVRVRALTFTIRKWAQTVGLTNPSPGRWISNFSLSMLVLFFLQQLKNPVLPSINAFVEAATKDDVRITEDQINCTFLRDLNQLKFQTTNTDSLSALLLKFFEFYSQFDFNFRAISLNEGKSVVKPDHSAMFIVNPFEKQLNVSKNVSLEETDRFRIEVRNAAWILESKTEHSAKEPWGLLALFKTPQQSVIRPQMFFKPRMVDISELMDDKESPLDGTSDNGVVRMGKLAFKNTAIKQQIEHIQRTSKTELNKMKNSVAGAKQTRIPRR